MFSLHSIAHTGMIVDQPGLPLSNQHNHNSMFIWQSLCKSSAQLFFVP